MQLLHNLARSGIIPYIYKLNDGDCLIIHEKDLHIYIILEGIMLLQKEFTNREVVTTHILRHSNIINLHFNNSSKTNYCYKIKAISTTYISSFSSLYKETILPIILKYDDRYNFYNYQSTAEILIHKNSKHRVIHSLLLLSELFGKYYHDASIIELKISHTILASLIGSNTNTISKILKKLEQSKLISYQKEKIVIYSLPLLSSNRYS